MSRLLRLVLALALLAGSLAAQAPPRSAAKSLKALTGGTLIDGFGGKPIRNSVIIVEGERITAVGQLGTVPIPSGAEIISTEGMTVLPGLWDMHVHLMPRSAARRTGRQWR
jgi:imidazolonepropionase-like amidohydrolase